MEVGLKKLYIYLTIIEDLLAYKSQIRNIFSIVTELDSETDKEILNTFYIKKFTVKKAVKFFYCNFKFRILRILGGVPSFLSLTFLQVI